MQPRVLLTALALVAGAGLLMAQTQPTPPKTTPPSKTTPGAPAPKEGEKPKAEATLKEGAPAPAIQMTEWIKGSPVTGFERGKVYIVEFWATWCPPCRDSIPHLTEIQKKHKDVLTVIGVAGSERKGKEGDDRLTKLRDFVSKQGDKMVYTIGFDADRKMVNAWMKPAGQNGIPCSFIVGADGKIAWIGNPLDDRFDAKVEAAVKAAQASKKS